MAQILSVDFETRATFDLRKGGVYPYAEHPDTDLWCMAFAFDDEPVRIWYRGDPFPLEMARHIINRGEMRAWNAQFERIIWNKVGVLKHGFPYCPDELWHDTAAEAAAMALPRSLDQCAMALGLAEQKDKEGYALMMKMTKPRAPRKGEDPTRLYWWEDAERLERLGAYCKQDVVVERKIAGAVRRLSAQERRIFLLDQRVNDRGILIDRELIHAAQDIATEGLERAAAALGELTEGAVASVSKVGSMKLWLAEQGIDAPSLAKKPLADLLESDLDPIVRQVLEVRADTAKSSVAKLKAMLDCACDDGRMRGLLLYHGAGTGRWSGRLAQPHNFPRPSIDDVECYIPDVLARRYDFLELIHPPLEIVSAMLRSCLIAAPGHRLVAADYAGIEARVANWLAGQWDIVEQFARNEDVYMYNAKRMFNLPATATKKTHPDERQGGKAVELGCGFGMGAEKFQTTARDMFGLELTEEQAKSFVTFYRESHPHVKAIWKSLNTCATAAVMHPGEVFTVDDGGAPVSFTKRGGYLWMKLPSGRFLCYARPSIVEREAPWSTEEKPVYTPTVAAWGMDSYTRRWSQFYLYGGLLLENAVQAIARDLMAEGMLRVEAAGYPVILTVHDEVVSEAPASHGSVAEFESLLATVPEWAARCPIAAEGWDGPRYRK